MRKKASKKIRSLMDGDALSAQLKVKEVCNVVAQAQKQKRIDAEGITKLLDAIIALTEHNVKLIPQDDLIRDAFKIATERGLTICDSVLHRAGI